VFGYRVNVAGNLIVACVYIQFHGTFDRITGLLFHHRISSTKTDFLVRPRDKWFLIPRHRERARTCVIDIPVGIEILLYTFTLFFLFLLFLLLFLFLFFLSLCPCQNRRGDVEREKTALIISSLRRNRRKITQTGWSISCCRRTAGLIDGHWHSFDTRLEQMRLVWYIREKKSTAWK